MAIVKGSASQDGLILKLIVYNHQAEARGWQINEVLIYLESVINDVNNAESTVSNYKSENK